MAEKLTNPDSRDAQAPKRLQHVIERLQGIEGKEFGKGRALLLESYLPKPPTEMKLSVESERPHRFEEVENIMLTLFMEYEAAKNGMLDELTLLRKTRLGGNNDTFAIDRMRSVLPDFDELRTIGISDKQIVVPTSFAMNLDKIRKHLESSGFTVIEKKDNLKRRVLEATSPTGGKFELTQNKIMFQHGVLENQPDLFDEGMTRFVEFMCLLRFKPDWAVGSDLVYLNELQPFLDLLNETPVKKLAGDLFLQVFDVAMVDIGDCVDFKETLKSKMMRERGKRKDSEKSYVLDKKHLPPHFDFVVVKKNEKKADIMVIQLDCHLNLRVLNKMLNEDSEQPRLWATSQREMRSRTANFSNKGSYLQLRQIRIQSFETKILDEEGRKVALLRTPGTLLISLDKDTKDAVIKLLNIIYDNALFYTSRIRDRELGDSKLIDYERNLANAINSMTQFYRFFLQSEHERESFNLAERTKTLPATVSATSWLLAKMKEAPSKDFNVMVLHALKAIDSEIKPEEFVAKYGREEETQKRAAELYRMLQVFIGRFEALCTVGGAEPQLMHQ
ncbi:MAG: hypothetical protein V1492_05530 [Candidatus Micrarchaeota archaeon]